MADWKRKILLLVEGAKTDAALMERLLTLYQLDVQYEIVSYNPALLSEPQITVISRLTR